MGTVLGFGALATITSTPAGADVCVNTVSGRWDGHYDGPGSGPFNAEFDFSAATAPDTATGTFDAPGVGGGPMTATVTCDGVFDFTSSGPVTFHSDAMDSATQSASGTWSYSGLNGTWVGGLDAPTVTAVDPTSGSPGDSVTITGSSFNSASSVDFGDTAATSFTVDSDNQITATAPAHAFGTVDITVIAVSGTSDTAPRDQFTYAVPVPVVKGVTPPEGKPAGGTSVTITGSKLTGASAVAFGGSAATSFVVDSDTMITAVSPPGTGTVDITVQTSFGTSVTSGTDQFVYGSGYPTLVESKHPIAYWRLGESNGNADAADSSGNGRDGTYDSCVDRGQPGAIVSNHDTAASFGADGCGMTYRPDESDSYTGDFSAEAWVKPHADVDKTWYTFISSRGADSDNSFDFKLSDPLDEDGQKHLFADVGSGDGFELTDGPAFDWSPDQWYDVAVTVDATHGLATFYVDGAAIGTRSFEPIDALLFDSDHPLSIGRNEAQPNEYFDGTIDDVALYPSVLSTSQLLNDYVVGTTSSTEPDAPTIGTATSSHGVASVKFTAPANDGGSAITGYTATCASSDGGATVSANGAISPISVGGVTVGNTYACTAAATNDIGTSAPSSPSNHFIASGCTGKCVSVGDASALEGDSKTRKVTFFVTLSQPPTTTVAVNYTITGVTATGNKKQLAGVDFKLKSGTATFAAGKITKPIAASVFGDTTVEPNETLVLTLSSPTGGYALGRKVGTGTIVNDDGLGAASTIGIGDASVACAASGSQKLKLPVTLSAPNSGTVTVTYTLVPGSATYTAKATGGDYGGKITGTITFSPGQTSKSVAISIWPHATNDPTQSFTVKLTGLTGSHVTLVRATATATILGGWH